MDWRNIPSLSALRAFEAAARLNSFSAAARDLNVTHAAIAQHVRALESEFGQSLLFRQGKRMELTEAGLTLSRSLTQGFSVIEQGVVDLANFGKEKPISVSITPSFAENWLLPRLGDFWKLHPDIQLNILPTTDLVDFQRDDVDLTIRYGRGKWAGTNATRLTSATYVIVGVPSLVGHDPVENIADLQDYHWLTQSAHGEHDAWAKSLGLTLEGSKVTDFSTGTLVVTAVRAGLGVAVIAKALVESEIQSGALTQLYQADLCDLAYYIVTPVSKTSENTDKFVKWLLAIA